MFPKDFVMNIKSAITRKVIHNAKPIVPVVELAQKYKNKLPLAVASGGSRYNVESSLAAIGLGVDYFDIVLTSQETKIPKPDPEIFLKCSTILGVSPKDCIVFEDGDFGIEAAKKANMPWIDIRDYIGDEYIIEK